MIYTQKMKEAITFTIKTHEVYGKQKRKGKDIPYITHPLTVGIILSLAGAEDEVVMAGLLHDTIEDSVPEKKVTKAMLQDRFGDTVADLVDSVTEQDQTRTWEESKRIALEHIAHFSHDAILVKSADTLSNVTEILDDHKKHGDEMFSRFHATKAQTIANYIAVIAELLRSWPESPLAKDLTEVHAKLLKL